MPKAKAKPRAAAKTVKNTTNAQAPGYMEFIKNVIPQSQGGGTMGQLPVVPGFWGGGYTQLSQTTTFWKNNRWYLISNMRQLVSEMYVEHGLIQTIVDVPVDDGFRGGIEISTSQLSEEQLSELESVIDEKGDLEQAAQGQKWNRLYGGAGIMAVDETDPSTPLVIANIDKEDNLMFRAVDMWELYGDKQNIEGYDPAGLNMGDSKFYSYYGTKVFENRVKIMKGVTAPSFIRPRLRGWGVSILETLVRSVNQYLKSTDLTFEVLDEFKIDVYKIKGLAAAMLGQDGEEAVQRRVSAANLSKNYNSAIAMDSEDDYQQKQVSFAGIAEAMEGIRMQVASDMRMPLTKIFGTSAAGFSSGQDDIENYNAMVESQVRQKSKYIVLWMVQMRCQQLFGMVPDDLEISFKPLRILSAEQEETCKTQQYNRLVIALDKGQITPEEFRDACNKAKLLPIQLQKKAAGLPRPDEAGDEGDDGIDQVNAPETRKIKTQAKDAKEAPV